MRDTKYTHYRHACQFFIPTFAGTTIFTYDITRKKVVL
jgi:hypothetical protein